MFSAEVIRVPILPLGMVNAFVIRSDGGCILVDPGTPGSEGKIARHAQTDHAGSAARLRQLSGAPILAHQDDAESGVYQDPLPHEPYEGFAPDISASISGQVAGAKPPVSNSGPVTVRIQWHRPMLSHQTAFRGRLQHPFSWPFPAGRCVCSR